MTLTIPDGMGGFRDIRYAEATAGARSYGKALLAAAEVDPRIVCLGADLSQPTQTTYFRDTLPERFFMVGIQEANMVGVAGGMARAGDIPFAHSFCVFITRRVYDQVAMQVAYPKLPVKLVGFIPGLTTELGVSHQAIDDIALMRALPNMAVIEPSGPEQVGAAVAAALAFDGPVYLRLSLSKGAPDETTPLQQFELGRGTIMREGADVAVVTSGAMVGHALEAAEMLERENLSATVVNMASIKPLDSALVARLARSHKMVVTYENHSTIGGLGSAVAEVIALSGSTPRFAMVGVNDVFAEGGSTPYLFGKYGLTAGDLYRAVKGLAN
ncbi:transketolase family protein [Phenylobacterium sp.]|jgi:transketolase|uniref:transketolase family protein n=1 Tax=Phenylobacterium sp. TaxID=1871053 RepID=UPI002F411E2F